MVSDKCSECGKHAGRRGGYKQGFKLCGRCIKKSSLPILFAKTHPKISEYNKKLAEKRKKRGRRFKKEEKIYLYWQHIKKGETSQQANVNIKAIEDIVRKGTVIEKKKTDFKEEFNKLVEKKNGHN